MDFEFFESISTKEARIFLDRFLELERTATCRMISRAKKTARLNFTIASIPPFFKWILPKLSVKRIKADPDVPAWINEADDYDEELFDFTEKSKPYVMRAAFYLGESFVQSYSSLSWGIGKPRVVQEKMPVVAGFEGKVELPAIMLADNVLHRILVDKASISCVNEMIVAWQEKLKKSEQKKARRR